MIRANTNESRQPEFGSQDNRQARSRRLSIAPDALSEPEQSIPRARRFRAGFATRFFDQRLSCGSPSSVSTTSLAQLREKLKDLPPFVFNKNYTRIAASPDLPGLKEEHQERSSNSQPKPRCGATRLRQYNSDSETHNFSKNIRQLSPIAEDSPSVLSATLDETNSPDQPTFIEAFKELQPRVDLVNLLVEEALNHGQDKDSGIISGKVTQDSDIVENTPFVDTAPRKKLGLRRQSKNPEEVRYTTDDSDVVNDTPCYDDWRKRSRTKRGQVNKIKIDDNETLNEQAVDAYFCQRSSIHCVEFISPDTIKKISETLSRDDVREDDYNIVDGIEIIEKHDEIDFAFEADIVDCVNDVLDKVCSDLDKCVDLLTEQQHQLDIENRDIPNRTTSFLKMNKDSLKSLKDKTNDIDNEDVQKVTLKFKPKKRAPKKNTVRQKKAKCVKPSDNVEDEDPKESTKSPLVGDVDATEQLIRKKRKLYSPKDDDNENNEIPRSRKDRRPSSSTESPIAACYKELENARKSRIRLPRKKTSTQPVISPNTKKLNDIFDKIKDNVVNNEKVKLVDKKSDKDMSLYNLSSESEDEVFKKKRIQVQKRISSSSLESTTKRRRSVKPVNYASYYSSEDECQKTAKPVAVKQTKPRSRKVKRIQSTDLTDERMRAEPPEVLETSFVQEKGHSNVPEEPQPAVNVPLLETIPEDVHEELVNVSGSKPQPPNKQEIIKVKTENRFKKRCDKLSKPTKRIKDTPRNVPTERESTTVSPLPGLVVESEPRKDDLTSSLDANLLQKLKKIYTDVEDLSTTRDTQNMLLNENDNDGINVDAPLSINNSNDNSVAENIQPVDISDGGKEEKSIDTGGRSPITGHNDLNESPPNLDALNESFQHRDVDVEDRSRSITEFLVNMRNQVLNTKAVKSTSPVIPITRMSTKDSTRSIVNKTPQLKRKKSVASSYIESVTSNPSVVLKRISSEDIESRVNPVTPKSQYSASRVALTRMSSDKVQKFLTPTRSMKSSSTVTPVVVLKRVSSDEINKWLPLPETKDVIEKKREKIPKWQPIPEIKNVIKKEPEVISRRTLTRRKSELKPCISCDIVQKTISPVKLNFDIVDLTQGTNTRSSKRIFLRSRSQSTVKTIKSRSNIQKTRTESLESLAKEVVDQGTSSQETVVKKTRRNTSKTIQTRSDIEKLRTEKSSTKEDVDHGISSQETLMKSTEATNVSKLSNKEKTVASTVASDMSKSVASVRSWLKKNAAESSKTDIATVKEMLYQEVMETLNTRLVEINEATGEALQAAFLKDIEELDSLKQRIDALEKSKMDRVCALIRADAEHKKRMLQLLKEDIQRILK